jgi:hypothetical protein
MTSDTQRNGCGERLAVLHGARKVGKQGINREPGGPVGAVPLKRTDHQRDRRITLLRYLFE